MNLPLLWKDTKEGKRMSFMRKITDLLNAKNAEKEPLDFNLPSREELNNIPDAAENKDDLELEEILRKIAKVKELAQVMGTTIDREEFYCSLIESKSILLDLVKYESKYDFDPPPSKDLERLERRKKEQIELLEERIAEKEIENVANDSKKDQEMSISKACAEINRANKLADIANKTTNREEFYSSVKEIEDILTELSKHEHEIDFPFSPSENLDTIRKGRDKQIALLEKRIAEANRDTSETEKRADETTNEKIASEAMDAEITEEEIKENKQPELEKKFSILEACSEIRRSKKLANIANKTTDREVFYNSINEIKSILRKLSEYEGKIPFLGSPSADLRNLEEIEQSQIELLEKRIKEKKESANLDSDKSNVKEEAKTVERNPKTQHTYMSDYDIYRFAKECNSYVEREEKKEQQEQRNTKIAETSTKTEKPTQPIYHDRFDEEYREVNYYRKIPYNDNFHVEYRPTMIKTTAFTGNNLSEPGITICAALIISGSVKRGEKIKPNEYYSYFERLYGVVNIQKLHCWLYENEYLRNATPKEALNLCKVPELKMILDSMGLNKGGNKPDLINRIVENIDSETGNKLSKECDRYFRSEKGERFLEENQDFVMYHRKQYGVMFNEFCKHRILQGRIRRFHDTIFNVLSQKAAEYQVKGYISQLEMIYHNLSESLYDEEKYELSLQYALYRLYFSTNLSSKYYLFSVENVKFDGVKTAENHILPEETFNPYTMARILELQPYFREQMIDVVYTPEILPYCIFEKYDLLDVVLDLYDGKFDAEHYTNYVRACYGKFIKKYL